MLILFESGHDHAPFGCTRHAWLHIGLHKDFTDSVVRVQPLSQGVGGRIKVSSDGNALCFWDLTKKETACRAVS
jgi:hypothetical protein